MSKKNVSCCGDKFSCEIKPNAKGVTLNIQCDDPKAAARIKSMAANICCPSCDDDSVGETQDCTPGCVIQCETRCEPCDND